MNAARKPIKPNAAGNRGLRKLVAVADASKERRVNLTELNADDEKNKQAARIAREARISEITIEDAVDSILDEVDRIFPSALPNTKVVHNETPMDTCGDFKELFRTAEMRDAEDLVMDAIESLVPYDHPTPTGDALESAVIRLINFNFEYYHAAVGFAAGIRAAGASKAAARTMMLGLLRNFNRETN